MPEVDTSIYNNIPKPMNPLETLSGVAGLQNTLNQNRLFQQQYQTNRAVSEIYKQAINPDGTIDQEKLTNLLATNPNASYGLPEAYKGSQEATQRNIGIDAAKLELAQKHITALNNYISPLLSNPKSTSGDVVGAIGHAVSQGLASPQEAAQFYATLPRSKDGRIDEAQIRPWLMQQQFQLMDAQQRLNAVSPAPQAVNTGGQTQFIRTPQVGSPSVDATIPNTLPPTTQVFNPQTNQMEFVGSGGASGARGGSGGGLAAAPPLGASEAAGVDATASAQQGVQLQSEADQVPAQKALLGNLEGALDKFTPGPGQGWKNEAAKFINQNNPFGNIFDPSKIASQEEFNKQATQLAQAQFKTLGGTGTDSKLDSAMHTSPNETLSKMGNKGIIAMLKGNVDAIAAKNQAWQQFKQSHGPQSYGQFSTEFNKTYDPRVFQSQYLTTDDRKKMLSGMTKSEQKGFLDAYRTALSNGWVKLPSAK